MSKLAFIYPGQGAQKSGMGADFYENSETARELYDEAGKALDLDMKALCFEENDLLDLTEYTQAALVTTCLAMTRVIREKGIRPDITAGLSLGEYAAIAAAGGMEELDAVRLVRTRGILMQNTVPSGEGAMCAVIGMKTEQIEDVLKGREDVSVANYNCPGQLVISGNIEAINEACEKLKAAGAKRALQLKVGGAFHSPLMQPAKDELQAAIEKTTFAAPKCPVYQNVDGNAHTEPEDIKANLIAQLTSSVRWTESVRNMIADGADDFTECGPGKALQGMIGRIDKSVASHGIE